MPSDTGYYELIAGEIRSMRSTFLTVASLEVAALSVLYTQLDPSPTLFGMTASTQAIAFGLMWFHIRDVRTATWNHIQECCLGVEGADSSSMDSVDFDRVSDVLKRTEVIIGFSFLVILGLGVGTVVTAGGEIFYAIASFAAIVSVIFANDSMLNTICEIYDWVDMVRETPND